MRGEDQNQQATFSYGSQETRVPKDHPLRPIRIMVDSAFNDLAPLFRVMYSHTGRPSIPPEQLLRASLLGSLKGVALKGVASQQLTMLTPFVCHDTLKEPATLWFQGNGESTNQLRPPGSKIEPLGISGSDQDNYL
jgi:hypothetical protein